jgi:hypothetical protein
MNRSFPTSLSRTLTSELHDVYSAHASLCNPPSIEVRVSSPISTVGAPVQLGLFCCSSAGIAAKCRITLYGGELLSESDFRGADGGRVKTHARTLPGTSNILDGLAYAAMYRRPTPSSAAELDFYSTAPAFLFHPQASDHSAEALLRFRFSPKGFMINSAQSSAGKANVRWENWSGLDAVQQMRFGVMKVLVATRRIEQGEELFIAHYQNSDEREHKFYASGASESNIIASATSTVTSLQPPRSSSASSSISSSSSSTLTIDDTVILPECSIPMLDSTSLILEGRFGEALQRLDAEGYLYIREVIEPRDIEKLRAVLINALKRKGAINKEEQAIKGETHAAYAVHCESCCTWHGDTMPYDMLTI